ncbi:hypothetical protein K505DRAFT_1365 [Melanomma pulvis-pyrius CBS 109.77]|uniref:Uncharacterized protein n=1 Tax=Melanomma pulvis-pyrius CBS 109.77 TaxID=1314802 RepID=A0A6A6XV67_9PLEO|nr:hypothetical protein K505DRAFT_1365 [Melanomma pulvis-pyrius CBS 109.77]
MVCFSSFFSIVYSFAPATPAAICNRCLLLHKTNINASSSFSSPFSPVRIFLQALKSLHICRYTESDVPPNPIARYQQLFIRKIFPRTQPMVTLHTRGDPWGNAQICLISA